MTYLRMTAILITMVLIVSCGGPKILTEGELNQLPPNEKEIYLVKMADKHPENAANYINLAKFYMQNDQAKKAFIVLGQGKERHPQNAAINYMYGQIAIQEGQQKLGFMAFQNVLNSAEAYTYKDDIAAFVQEKYAATALTTDKAADAYPVFAPDGEHVYFQSNRDGNWNIYKINIINQETEAVTSFDGDEELPWVSSDGKWLYFCTDKDDQRPIQYVSKSRNIYKMNLLDKTVTALTSTLADDWMPRSVASGNRIAFVSDREDFRENVSLKDKQSNIFTMEASGEFQIPVFKKKGFYGTPVFSGDGKFLFYSAKFDGNMDIYRYSIASETNAAIIREPGVDNSGPFPSPDNSRMAYFSNKDGNFELYLFNFEDNTQERLTANPSEDLNPVFSPDGRKLVFFSNRLGNYDIFLLDFDKPAGNLTLQQVQTEINRLVENL